MLVASRSKQFWNTKTVKYCSILMHQYLGLEIHFSFLFGFFFIIIVHVYQVINSLSPVCSYAIRKIPMDGCRITFSLQPHVIQHPSIGIFLYCVNKQWITNIIPQEQGFFLLTCLHIPITPTRWFLCFLLFISQEPCSPLLHFVHTCNGETHLPGPCPGSLCIS